MRKVCLWEEKETDSDQQHVEYPSETVDFSEFNDSLKKESDEVIDLTKWHVCCVNKKCPINSTSTCNVIALVHAFDCLLHSYSHLLPTSTTVKMSSEPLNQDDFEELGNEFGEDFDRCEELNPVQFEQLIPSKNLENDRMKKMAKLISYLVQARKIKICDKESMTFMDASAISEWRMILKSFL